MLVRIYCRRRDGVWFRFNSLHALRSYSRANHESKRTLPIKDRSEFIVAKNRYENPRWIHSCQYEGMAILTDAKEGVVA